MEHRLREFGSEYEWSANHRYLRPAHPAFPGAAGYRSGRDAMKAVAAAVKDRYSRVLLPALCCSSMVTPFTDHGFGAVFYRLDPDYRADIADVTAKLTDGTVLVYGSYFGIEPFSEATLCDLRRRHPGVLFMEDRTQDIFLPRQSRAFDPDVTVASFRKWTAVPDGGLLWSGSLTCAPGKEDDTFARLRTEAMALKDHYLSTGDPALKDRYRAMLAQASDLLDLSPEPYGMAPETEELLQRLDLAKMLARRVENAHALEQALTPAVRTGAVKLIVPAEQCTTVYFPILVEDQAATQRALAQAGIFCPVIWPVPEGALGVCPVAEYTAAHMLGVPCDHRYDANDMAHIGAEIVRITNEQ